MGAHEFALDECHVLVAEIDRSTREMWAQLLTLEGCKHVEFASTPTASQAKPVLEALGFDLEHHIQLVLLDLWAVPIGVRDSKTIWGWDWNAIAELNTFVSFPVGLTIVSPVEAPPLVESRITNPNLKLYGIFKMPLDFDALLRHIPEACSDVQKRRACNRL
jgi:hypothetical protein